MADEDLVNTFSNEPSLIKFSGSRFDRKEEKGKEDQAGFG
jgi:hypothetical protein